MARNIDPTRACRHVAEWPLADQQIWQSALVGNNLEDEATTSAARWRPTTTQTNREGYGRWITHLARSGVDLQISPAERVTPSQVRAYIVELRDQGLALQSCCNRISQLLCVMLAVAPDRDWGWLKKRANRMAGVAGRSLKGRAPLSTFTGDILNKALRALKKAERSDRKADRGALLEYRNWLMVATLALVPLRRHNFSNLALSVHLRVSGDDWSFEIPAKDTKQKRAISISIPPVLHPHFNHYLACVRPLLLAGSQSDRLWISTRRTGMTAHSTYIAITDFTRIALGTEINPTGFGT